MKNEIKTLCVKDIVSKEEDKEEKYLFESFEHQNFGDPGWRSQSNWTPKADKELNFLELNQTVDSSHRYFIVEYASNGKQWIRRIKRGEQS